MNTIDWSKTITPAIRAAEREANARSDRDACIASSIWVIERHRGQIDLLCDTSITDGQYKELLLYHQALRDWPDQPSWPDIEMPPAPDWLSELKK
ncbi:hypothetical protein [Aeromonas veronii]|uniref:hypothetical protein n=1 Tax=Aeromonas veronii TaxID=654 RepID=UPI003B9DDC0C